MSKQSIAYEESLPVMSAHRIEYRRTLEAMPREQWTEMLYTEDKRSTCVGLDGEEYRELDAIANARDIRRELAKEEVVPEEPCVMFMAKHVRKS
jgi:hypothetical protein